MSLKQRAFLAFATCFAIAFLLGLLGLPETPLIVISLASGLLTYYVLQMLAGNRKIAYASSEDRNDALHHIPPPGQSLLYVYRDTFVGKALGVDVSLDGTSLAQLKSPRFTMTTLTPGEHTLTATVSGFAGAQNHGEHIVFQAVPAEATVYAIKIAVGRMRNSIYFVKAPDPSAALTRLANVPMVTPDP